MKDVEALWVCQKVPEGARFAQHIKKCTKGHSQTTGEKCNHRYRITPAWFGS